MKRRVAFHFIAVAIGSLCLGAGTLLANGQEFFPAAKGKVDLVYFGVVKDARTGRPVRDHAYITIRDRVTGMSIPFTGDKPGHYRTPDIGAAIKELGEVADPQQLEFTLVVPGYRKVKLEKLPRKSAGAIEMSFKVEPEGSPEVSASAASATISANGGGGNSGPSIPIVMFVVGVALAAIAAVGRTFVRPATTGG